MKWISFFVYLGMFTITGCYSIDSTRELLSSQNASDVRKAEDRIFSHSYRIL